MEDDDDGGFGSHYRAPKMKEEKPRSELLNVRGPRVPKAKARQAANQAASSQVEDNEEVYDPLSKYDNSRVTNDAFEYDPYADNPLRRAEQKELEQLVVKKSKEVTSDLRRALKVSEDTKNIGAQTLVTLHEQGEQLVRAHEKVVQMDQELSKGEKLLGKLGPMFSFGWKPKKGKKITGPTYTPGERTAYDTASRSELGLKKKGATARGDEGWEDEVGAERDEQDDILDAVSVNLADLKNMALDMGRELTSQEKAIDDLTADSTAMNTRQQAANSRGRRILGRR